jgi:branched-chain amino acid transport system ATP-binding protein
MLQLQGITAGYGAHTVLRDVTLDLPDATAVALVGPNGAGKSTLLRVASGLIRPAAGRIVLDGRDITAWSPSKRAAGGLCHIPEGRGVFRSLSVADNLVMHGGSRHRAPDRYPILAERLGQQAATLSGGEQQMLALARIDVTRPRLALIDEVSMGLSPRLLDELYAHLHELAAGGLSLLLVEQHVRRALALADHVYVLQRGRLVWAGEPGQLGDEDLIASYLGAPA